MTPFELVSVLVTAAALLGFLSHCFLRVPMSIGITMLALALSIVLIGAGHLFGVHAWAVATISSIDFPRLVLHGMLAFLLFAGSLSLDQADLRREQVPVLVLAIVGTVLSTVLVGGLIWGAFQLIGLMVPLMGCLLFGALISPTDPIAVLAILRGAGVSKALEMRLAGESLLNDGVGAVLFITLLEASNGGTTPKLSHVLHLLGIEAGGGILLGLALGKLTSHLLGRIADYQTEIMLTLALAMGGYALADALHLSAPLEAVVAGLCLAGRQGSRAFSEQARDYRDKFWELVDGMLNAVLFLLLGFEILVMRFEPRFLLAGALAIPVILLTRWISVAAPLAALRCVQPPLMKIPGETLVLTWGGLRGGLAIALALSLPNDPYRSLLLAVTYIVVIFSIVAQGLTIPRLARRVQQRALATR